MTTLTRRHVSTTAFGGRKDAPYSYSWAIPPNRGLLFTSGLIARDPQGDIAHPYDVEAQTRLVMENMKALLAEAGCTLADVFRMTVNVRDIKSLAVISEVFIPLWPTEPPAMTGVEVSRLLTDDVMVEIEAIALLPEGYWES